MAHSTCYLSWFPETDIPLYMRHVMMFILHMNAWRSITLLDKFHVSFSF